MGDITQFMELFRPLPGNRYIQVTTKIDVITKALYDLLESVGGELKVAYYYDSEKPNKSDTLPHAKIEEIGNFVNAFRALPREHDRVILKDIFSCHHNQKLLLRIAYTTLANSAEIVIMEKKGILNIEQVKEMLEDNEYRAANSIELLQDYDVIVAKKMHMWGNGL